ncbi:hypothetical protein JCM10207_001785 [Rhodosporidiobolus poonsookiae]
MAPPPPDYLFLPDSLNQLVHRARTSPTSPEDRLWAWGAKGREEEKVKVAVGVLAAPSTAAAARVLAKRSAGGASAEWEVMAELRRRDVKTEAGGRAGEEEENSWEAIPVSPRGSNVDGTEREYTVVLYSPLKDFEVLALQPLKLDFTSSRPVPSPHPSSGPAKSSSATPRTTSANATSTPPSHALEQALAQINASRALLNPAPSQPSRSFLAPVVRALSPLAALLYCLGVSLLAILAYPLPFVGSLTTFSAFARQLHTRLSQALSLAPTYRSFRRDLAAPSPAHHGAEPYVAAHASYIRFFNLLWLLANDLIIGHALSSLLCDNIPSLARLLTDAIEARALPALHALLAWLTSWPMGIKLNDELSAMLSGGFGFLLRVWAEVILHPLLLPSLPALLSLLALSAHLGATAALALSCDLLALGALPLTAAYGLAEGMWRATVTGVGGLFDVFRGKKYNPLRARSEPAAYATDALLLGTILFVMLAFLAPTVGAYYLVFCSIRLALLGVHKTLQAALGALNAFPLFALMLRFKAPGRLPGGVHLEACARETCGVGRKEHLHLRNQPLCYFAILSSLSSALDLLNPAASGSFFYRLATASLSALPSRSLGLRLLFATS